MQSALYLSVWISGNYVVGKFENSNPHKANSFSHITSKY